LSVLGQECHIASAADQGPRANHAITDPDGYANLILLCPNDHRLIDTLVDDYPIARLLELKRTHEAWVKATLECSTGVAAITIARGEPTFLRYLGSARELLAVAASVEESSLDHEDLESADDVDLVAGFLQNVHDTAEMWDEFEPADRIRYTYDLDREIRDLEARGWRVFGARVPGKMQGGVSGADTSWDTAYLRLVRADSPTIIQLEQAANPATEDGAGAPS
jgi:hypothetical protein